MVLFTTPTGAAGRPRGGEGGYGEAFSRKEEREGRKRLSIFKNKIRKDTNCRVLQ